MTRYEQNATTKVQRDDKSLFKVQHAVNQNYPRDLGLMCNFFGKKAFERFFKNEDFWRKF